MLKAKEKNHFSDDLFGWFNNSFSYLVTGRPKEEAHSKCKNGCKMAPSAIESRPGSTQHSTHHLGLQ